MELSEFVGIEIRLLSPYHRPLSFEILAESYGQFYGKDESAASIRHALDSSVADGLVTDGEDGIRLTREGMTWSHNALMTYAFGESGEMERNSETYQEYRRRRREAGYFGITDSPQRDFISSSLATLEPPVLDLGCGDGTLTTLLQARTGHQFVGVDVSSAAIEQAQNATGPASQLSFLLRDFNDTGSLDIDFGSAILVDSLYFAADPVGLLSWTADRISSGGGIIALYSLYAGPGKEPALLSPRDTPFSAVAETHSLDFEVTDFGDSEINHWRVCMTLLAELRDSFLSERAGFLYYSSHNEAVIVANMVESRRSARYGFVLRRQ